MIPYSIMSEQSKRIQNGRYSLSVTDKKLILSDGIESKVFDLDSFIITPFLPDTTNFLYPIPNENGVEYLNSTLIQCLQSMGQFVFNSYTKLLMNDGAIALISGSIKNLETITSGFNTNGTELTITKLNGFRLYGTSGGVSGATPGPAPWLVGVKTDGVCEMGRILDFHTGYINGTNDFTCRIECTAANTLSIPNITATGNITSTNITTLTNRITAEETKSTNLKLG